MKPQTLQSPPFHDALPAPIVFRVATMPADAAYPQHRHAWGEFVYSFSGVMEIKLAGQHFLAPPHYGVWLPPHVEHMGLNRQEACHCSVYLAEALCEPLPRTPSALTVSPLVRALLDHLRLQSCTLPASVAHERLLRVLVDQLVAAPRAGSYLPTSQDPLLAPVLQALEDDPADNRPLAELARAAHTTERTLVRRCQRDLGMPFAEWRQRLRVVKALPRLESGEKVESIALGLGYGSSSAFISMFRRLMAVTPDEFRKGAATRAHTATLLPGLSP